MEPDYTHHPTPAAQLDPEVAALSQVTGALDGLADDAARGRVVSFILSRYGQTVGQPPVRGGRR